jgi:hypothetical protein
VIGNLKRVFDGACVVFMGDGGLTLESESDEAVTAQHFEFATFWSQPPSYRTCISIN